MASADRIKFDAPNSDILVWKYPNEDIKLGSQLIVNQSQEAVFVKSGKAFDVFTAGTHTLETGNLSILGKFLNFTFGEKTPFTAEVWFINKTVKRGLKWGTKAPIQMLDPVYQYPVSVRAFGEWGLRIENSQSFVNQIVGSQIGADVQKIEEYFSGEIVQKLSNYVSQYFIDKNISIFQINAKLNELSIYVQNEISPEFERFGIEIVNFNIERISIPDEEQKKFQEVLGKKMEISQLNEVNVSQNYTAIKTLDAFEKAAEKNGGVGPFVGAGLGIAAGIPLAQNLSSNIGVSQNSNDNLKKLQELKQLLDAGLITQDEFNAKKQEVLSKI